MARTPDTLRRRIAHLPFPLRGRRLELVPPSLVHLSSMVRLLNEPSVAHWTLHIPHPYRAQNGRDFLRNARRNRRAGSSLVLMVVRRSDGALLGGVGLHHLEEGHSTAEAGWWIGREHRHRGYAAEAVDLLVRTGFDRLGLHRVEARVFPRNRASRGVARSCGFRYEGRLQDEVQKNGRWVTTLLFARVASDRPIRR